MYFSEQGNVDDDATLITIFLVSFNLQSCCLMQSTVCKCHTPSLCAACGSVVRLHAARVFDYFVVLEIAFMDNQAQITETISRLHSEKVR